MSAGGEIEGMGEVLGALNRFAEDGVDLRRVEEKLKDRYHTGNAEQFQTEGGRSGGWETLSSPYGERKAEKYGTLPIEQRTGALMRSLTGDGEGSVSEVTKDEATFDTSVPYAKFQTRPLVVLTDVDEEEYARIIEEDAAEFGRSLGFGSGE
jgi:hypothetical protein